MKINNIVKFKQQFIDNHEVMSTKQLYPVILFIISFTILCGGCLFLTSSAFVNEQNTPKWFCFVFCAPIVWLLIYWFLHKQDLSFDKIVFPCCLIITCLCLIQSSYGIAQYCNFFPVKGNFRVTGSFDNPAGFAACLCAGAPFFLYFIINKNPYKKWLAIIALIIIGLAVFLSGSRAGMLSLAVVCIFGLFHLFIKVV